MLLWLIPTVIATIYLYIRTVDAFYVMFFAEYGQKPTWLGVFLVFLFAPVGIFPWGFLSAGEQISNALKKRRGPLSRESSDRFIRIITGKTRIKGEK